MAKHGLKNFVRTQDDLNGQPMWRLETRQGAPVEAFDIYCKRLTEYSYRTQKRYAEVTSRFLDYLFEAGVFQGSISSARLNEVVDAYPTLLRSGSVALAARVRQSGHNTWLADVAEALDWQPIQAKSFDNIIPAINRFLRLSERLAKEAEEKAALLGLAPRPFWKLIQALDGQTQLSPKEVAALKQNSVLGSVAKFLPHGIRRARGLRGPGAPAAACRRPLDFPRESLAALISAANNWRDKAFWLLLSVTGIRTSEALNLQLHDVNFERQKIYVFDPNHRRAMVAENNPDRLRFKGREMAHTYLIPSLVDDLFFALNQYIRLELVPRRKPGESEYLFQYVDPSLRGLPYVDASATTLSRSFKRAVRAAGVPTPPDGRGWSLHSLRHMYGVFMVNDYPVDPLNGKFGLPLVDVQMMMGHATIRATSHYARAKERRLEAKLAASDQVLLAMTVEELQGLKSFDLQLSAQNDQHD